MRLVKVSRADERMIGEALRSAAEKRRDDAVVSRRCWALTVADNLAGKRSRDLAMQSNHYAAKADREASAMDELASRFDLSENGETPT